MPADPAEPAPSLTERPAEDSVTQATGINLAELVTVILLSVTAILTAWTGFQASKWEGATAISFNQASEADDNLALMAVLLAAGALILAGFFAWIRSREHAGKEALLSTGLFHNRTSNLALVTQNVQWAMLLGTSFVVSAYLQVVLKYNAIQTGVIFTTATVGILLSSLAAGRLARRYRQRTLILAGFVTTIAGIIVLLAMVKGHPGAWYFAPGLFLIGVGLGVMLTPSVNVVQSAFPEKLQGEISGLSRSISNLGSSFGTAIAGTILVAGLADPKRSYGIAMIVLAFLGLIGLGATILLPAAEPSPGTDIPASTVEHPA